MSYSSNAVAVAAFHVVGNVVQLKLISPDTLKMFLL